MKLNKKSAKLICELERIIGNECFNPNSYDGWTGEEGKKFRYPVWINASKKDNSERKLIPNEDPVKPEYVETLKYKFGSNHLLIGIGLIRVLNYLEERYGIDFNELEKNVKK